MTAVRTLALALVASAGVTLAACAAKTGSSTPAAGTFVVPIEIENLAGMGGGGASVYISTTSGSRRRLLGPIDNGQKKTFQYDAREGNYELTARLGLGQDSVVSEAFQLTPNTVISWSFGMGTNRLLMGTRQQ